MTLPRPLSTLQRRLSRRPSRVPDEESLAGCGSPSPPHHPASGSTQGHHGSHDWAGVQGARQREDDDDDDDDDDDNGRPLSPLARRPLKPLPGMKNGVDEYLSGVDEYLDGVDRKIDGSIRTRHRSNTYRSQHSQQWSDAEGEPPREIYDRVETGFPDRVSPTKALHELPHRDKYRSARQEWTQKDTEDYYPSIKHSGNPARVLRPSEINVQRAVFLATVVLLNVGALMAALFSSRHAWVLAFILFVKAKDCLSVVVICVDLVWTRISRLRWPEGPVEAQWILSCIPTYSETEEQIVKTIFSLRDNGVAPHRQVMCVIIDGKPRDIRSHLTRTITSFRRPYITSRFKRGQLMVDAGFIEDVPVIILEKVANAGKKDSLVLCHDLFNHPRPDMPLYSRLLRLELWHSILPVLTRPHRFARFDMIFCTDADSTLHPGAIKALADSLARSPDCIAACGLVLVEFEIGHAWSFWNLFQQFQYTFGQFVRRRAESVWGKVTCLPGCITMVAVRPEMAGAIRKYAAPVTAYPVLAHQVQYLGTDRRLTYSMLSQSKALATKFVPGAVCETVAPLSLRHYLSQRRRWGSNAYFNNIFYCFGERMVWITRLIALMELVRLTMVYYRLANTVMFLYALVKHFSWTSIIPLLVVTQLPTAWFVVNALVVEPWMRRKAFKLLVGFCIDKIVAPLLSIVVFTRVATNLGSQVWGMTGGSNAATAAAREEIAARGRLARDGDDGDDEARRVHDTPAGVVVITGSHEAVPGLPVVDLPGEGAVDEEREEKLAGLLP